jgi:hypothetical protein
MRRRVALGLVAMVALVAVVGCGGERESSDDQRGASEPAATSEPDSGRLYQANTTVLESRRHGPMLCLGGVLTSLPPQCGDVAIEGWDWRAVEGEEALGGTTWGSYHVVGRYDGETFTLSEVAPYEPPAFEAVDFASPCQEPAGGWRGLDHATQEDVSPADAYAGAQPDYVVSWITQLEPSALERSPVIFNAIFSGDAERHEAEIGKRWRGPLCVIARDVPTARELNRIRREAEASLDELGLQMLSSSSGGPGVEQVIEIRVVVDADGNGQATFDARYGLGVVRLVSALTPAS